MSTQPQMRQVYPPPRPPVAKIGVIALILVPLLILGLSFVPGVGARVPGGKAVRSIVKKTGQRVAGLGRKLIPGSKRRSTGQRPPIIPPAVTPGQPGGQPAGQPAVPRPYMPLTVASTPAGATVQLNGYAMGKTPVTLEVAPGTYQVTVVKEGYAPVTRTLTLNAGESARLDLPLMASKPAASGATGPGATSQKLAKARLAASIPLTVKSTPTGATVKLNGQAVGKTPLTVKVAPGSHKVTLSRAGYAPVTRTVTVKAGTTSKLTVALPVARGGKKRPVAAPAKKRPPVRATGAKGLTVGAKAPAIALKDRSGTVHSLSAKRGKQVVVLFVWRLDAQASKLIKDLDGRVRRAGASHAGMVIVVNGNRAAVRQFVSASRVRVPILLGTDQIARTYSVPKGTTVLYLVSAQGVIAQRQANSIQLAPVFVEKGSKGKG